MKGHDVELDWGGLWDVVVVGGGTAGIVGARTAAGLGARVLLVERDRTGGDCLYTGCVPSKAVLAAAGAAAAARNAARLGIDVAEVGVDFTRVMAHVRAAIAALAPADSPEALESTGVPVVLGHAVIGADGTVAVNGRRIAARQVLLAMGAAPAVPVIDGIRVVPVLTSETIWGLEELPERLAVIGGGPVGCELGQAFARLGSTVTIIGSGPRLLPREDPDASELLRLSLVADGVRVLTGTRAASVTPGTGGGTVVTHDGQRVGFTHLLAATGRAPRTAGLGLAAAGIDLDERGRVVTDRHLRTSKPGFWAAGDVTAHPQYTHTAGVHAGIAAANAVLGPWRTISPVTPPRVTFTDPEIAAVGEPTGPGTEQHRQSTIWHTHLDRAVTQAQTAGFTRLAVGRRGRLTGGTVVGPRAGETIGELSLAVHLRLRTSNLARATHPYPTHNDALWNAAILEVLRRLHAPVPAALTRLVAAARRRRPARG
ncbi:dihydrolipoyl dehydrogenase family protein [Specibacter cremeus]|uniref:dihydrolipoyl dehydrogenase family protein n=1 Tax=Specibacter cremeus TaxID=1629051 RepID=UPI00197CB4D7|nr:FAD-dependent oxidoreductase [Specibacter cremeus]